MLRVYFDDELIDVESYTELDNEYKLFTDTFKLGSVASNTFKLSVLKTAVNSQPYNVRIEDGNTVMNFIVDNVTEDDYVYAYTLTDRLMNFNFDYDASILIEAKKANNEDCYLSDIWKDMCNKADVEYDEDYIFENDIIVNWYDSRVKARRYLSFVAELQSGYAYIREDGKLSFKKQKHPSVKTIDGDEVSDLIIGEHKKITRVVFDGGAFKWERGNDTGETLYLQRDNVFIVNEEIVENIYNSIKDFEFYIIEAPQAPMDSSIRAGNVITFVDNGKSYPTIAQYSMSYAGGWTGGYKLSVNTERQQETQITRTADNVKDIQVKVDRLNNEFGIIAEEIEKLTDYIRNVGTTGNYVKLPNTPKSFGAINKLSIKGFELMPLYPGMAYPSEYTFPGVLSFYTLIFDTVLTFDNEPNYVFINSPIPLQKLGTVYDELIIEANKVKVIQRIGYDDVNEKWSVLSNPITHELNDVLLPTFDGDTFVSVKYFDNLVYDAEYIVKNDLTSNFATQLESSSQFKLNQNEIEAKVNKDGIISSINLSPEEIKILAEKIKIEGLTTINNNFKVLLDGSIEAKKGKFSGDVTADNLYLNNGGRVISGEGLLTNLYFRSNGIYASYSPVGFTQYTEQESGNYNDVVDYNNAYLDVYIPDNFTIVSANLILQHSACRWTRPVSPFDSVWGYSRNIKVYKVNAGKNYKIDNANNILTIPTSDITEIPNALGSSSWTPSNTTGGTVETKIGTDIKNYLNSGHNIFVAKSNDSLPAANNANIAFKTGAVIMAINIEGYMSYDKT